VRSKRLKSVGVSRTVIMLATSLAEMSSAAYRDGPRWHEVRSEEVNAFLKNLVGDAFSAKDFRTWHVTVLAAAGVAAAGPAGGGRRQAAGYLEHDRGGCCRAQQHAGRLSGVVHRSEGLRPLPGGQYDPPAPDPTGPGLDDWAREDRGGGSRPARRSVAVSLSGFEVIETQIREWVIWLALFRNAGPEGR
jgi:hypothetical protein